MGHLISSTKSSTTGHPGEGGSTAPQTISKKPIHEQGVTGANMADTSRNPADHFIDLDTASMESAPDVRSYFWLIGHLVRKEPEVPLDLKTRIVFDAELVREGREWLRDFRDAGRGWFLSTERDVMSYNEPGSEWYRIPTAGICHDFDSGRAQVRPDECAFFDSVPTTAYEGPEIYMQATNLRVPMMWAESSKEGVLPGTRGWDQTILAAYCDNVHPALALRSLDYERDGIIYVLVKLNSAPHKVNGLPESDHDELAVDYERAEQVLRRDWSELERPYRRSQDDYLGPGYLEMQGLTADEFLGRQE